MNNVDNVDFTIFDESKESYIIGDLLNMPKFFADWNSNPHNNDYMYDLFIKTSLQYKDNILGIYEDLRIDKNESIPNVSKIQLSVDTYISRNESNIIFKNLLSSCDNNRALFVHLRSGDKGIVEDTFINTIIDLSINYDKIIILCGIHQNSDRSHYFPNVTESIKNMKISLSNLYIKSNNIILDLNTPDIHLCIMRRCKNLLLHKGGFSLLGGLLFNGKNLFITNIFDPVKSKNKEYFTYVTPFRI